MRSLRRRNLILIIFLAVAMLGVWRVALGADADLRTALNAEHTLEPVTQTNADSLRQGSGLLYLVGWIASKTLELTGSLVVYALNIGNDVIRFPVVDLGANIVLGFANLGFVLAIIIIAFATIFQLQSYAMKQTLWKLIVAALLVNFSLTIAGAFLSVSNIFSNYFLSRSTPSDLATVLANALAPQWFPSTKDVGWWDLAKGGLSYVLQYIASLFFVVVFTFIIVLTFIALFVMLLIRVIALAILLILMPLVWLLWIFPATSGHWKKWWSEFLRWTFFAPAMLFFIYLVVATQARMAATFSGAVTTLEGLPSTAAFYRELAVPQGFVGRVAQLIVMVGLLMGGLIVANKLSIHGAQAAYGFAVGTGKKFGGWAGRKGLQYGTSPLRRKYGEEGKERSLAERTTDWANTRKTAVGRWGAGWVARGTAKLSAAGGEDLVGKAEARIKNKSLAEKKAMLASASAPERIALARSLTASGDLEGMDMKFYKTAGVKNQFERFGHGKAFSDMEKASGGTVGMQAAAVAGDFKKLREETEKFIGSLSDRDISKMQHNDIFSSKPQFGYDKELMERMQHSLAYGFAENLPGAFSKITPKIKPQNFVNYKKTVDMQINVLTENKPEAGKAAKETFGKNLGWRTIGTVPWEEATGGTTGGAAATT